MSRNVVRPLTAKQLKILSHLYQATAAVTSETVMEMMLCADLARIERSIETLIPDYVDVCVYAASGKPTYRISRLGATVISNVISVHREVTGRANL